MYACKFSAPGIPVNRFGVIACSIVLPSAINLAINTAEPGLSIPACSICSGLCASAPTHPTGPVAVCTTPAPTLAADAAILLSVIVLVAASIVPVVFLSNAALIDDVGGTVDAAATLTGLVGAPALAFAAAIAGLGAAGNAALALLLTLTSTP